ncbi:MAG: GFA family protein [Zavarzinia sp.]|nr:GFA family protein [Zavarzinia sp.]
MAYEGGCYCGSVRYVAEGDPLMQAECLCRECQYISGGGPNFFLALPVDGFRYTKGTPKSFTRTDIPNPVTRDFCPDCGTHLVTRTPALPAAILKIGTLDDPKQYGGPQFAIYGVDRQPFQCVQEGLAVFERLPQ